MKQAVFWQIGQAIGLGFSVEAPSSLCSENVPLLAIEQSAKHLASRATPSGSILRWCNKGHSDIRIDLVLL